MAIDEHAATWSAFDKLDEIRKLLGIGIHDDVVAAVRHVIESRTMEMSGAIDLLDGRQEAVKAEYAKLKAVAEGQDALIAELRLALSDGITSQRIERQRLMHERDEAERAATYFAKRMTAEKYGD